MESLIVGIYCECDDWLCYKGQSEPQERKITDAEGVTIALVASYAFGSNYSMARWMLAEQKYIQLMSKSRYSRRLNQICDAFIGLFY